MTPWILCGLLTAIYVTVLTLEMTGRTSTYRASIICAEVTLIPIAWTVLDEQWLVLALALLALLTFTVSGWTTRPRKERP